MNLYEINAEICGLIDTETGEVSDYEKLISLNMALDEKKENIALYIKNLVAESDAIKAEKDALSEREKTKRAQAERLSEYLSSFLAGEAFETARVKCSFRKSSACVISDEAAFALAYPQYTVPQPPKISKTLVSSELKAGVKIDGAEIVERQNLQIK